MISEAELLSRSAVQSLYEGRPLTKEEKAALRELIANFFDDVEAIGVMPEDFEVCQQPETEEEENEDQ